MREGQFLSELVEDLYRRAGGQKIVHVLPIRMIDDPEVVNKIFNQPEIFIKNYSFLKKLSQGRFSANARDWEDRAKLTQHYYHQSTHKISDAQIYEVYANSFLRLQNGEIESIWECVLEAAIKVISMAYGLVGSIPWPIAQIDEILKHLAHEQTEAWLNPVDISGLNNSKLSAARESIWDLWSKDREVNQFLSGLLQATKSNDPIYAKEELLQNLLAATETTVSGFSWIAYCLGRFCADQNALASAGDLQISQFIDEALRLFPPVPLVTRRLSQNHVVDGIQFIKDENILISIVGLHCHAGHWSEPLKFQFPRSEFLNGPLSTLAYRPFLSGPRVCGGMRLAKRELLLGTKAFLNHFRLSKISSPPIVKYLITSRPALNLDAYLKKL